MLWNHSENITEEGGSFSIFIGEIWVAPPCGLTKYGYLPTA